MPTICAYQRSQP